MNETRKRHWGMRWPMLVGVLLIGGCCFPFIRVTWIMKRSLCEGYERILSVDLERLRDDCRALCQQWTDLPGELFDASTKVLNMEMAKRQGVLPSSLEKLAPGWVRVSSSGVTILVARHARLDLIIPAVESEGDALEGENSPHRHRLLSGVWIAR